jgi:hypothetical protein
MKKVDELYDTSDIIPIRIDLYGKNVVGLIQSLKQLPSLFLGESSISILNNVIVGYNLSCNIHNINDKYIKKDLLRDFREFLLKYYNSVDYSLSWHNLILKFNENNEEKSLNEFFRLFDLFLVEKKIKVSKKNN